MKQFGSHFCGGSLISVGDETQTDIVVTAGHCVAKGTRQLTVTAGGHDLNNPAEGEQTVDGAETVFHEDYVESPTTLNDVAVVKLATPIKFTETIQPICLPSPDDKPKAGTAAMVAGWGVTQEGGRKPSNILMQTNVPVIGEDDCAKQYKALGHNTDPKMMLCAGWKEGRKDTCQGDSGGSLVFEGKDGFVLQGAVSFGIGCARANVPGVYARTANYLDWINAAVDKLSEVKKN